VREYPFELAVSAACEARFDGVVARQLGGSVANPGGRVWDTVVVEPGPTFDERAALTDRTVPPAAVEADVGPGEAVPPAAAFDCHPERRGDVVDAAVAGGYLERVRTGGQDRVRATTRYPDDWFGDLWAVENKPDLDRPGALERQLRTDVSLALADRVVLATASHVTGAHLNRIPDAVGVWRVHPEGSDRSGAAAPAGPADVEVLREPAPLPVDDPGVEVLDRHPGRVDVAVVDPAAKARVRRRVAERAYGKGWRPGAYPDCAELAPDDAALPVCAWKGRVVDPREECGPACPGHDPDPTDVDDGGARAERTDWRPDPPGPARRQSGLDRFG
jgi:hypothetical protein